MCIKGKNKVLKAHSFFHVLFFENKNAIDVFYTTVYSFPVIKNQKKKLTTTTVALLFKMEGLLSSVFS